jgi:tetratricopeptide (TPR) repeat protein
MMHKNPGNVVLRTAAFCLIVALLAACASNPATPARAQSTELYDGQPRAVFATEFPPGSSAEAAARGDQALRRGDMDRALYFYVEAVSLDPQDVSSMLKIGAIHYQRRNDRLALIAYRMALAEEPDNAAALEGAGLVMFRTRQTTAAQELLTRAVSIETRLWRSHDALGVMADLRSDYDAAIGHYSAALEIHPGAARLYNNRGYSYYLSADLDSAAEDFMMAAEIEPDLERAWRNLALVRVRQGRYDEALEVLLRVAEEPKALNDIGYLAMLEGRYDVAERYLSDAISSSPTYYRLAHRNYERLRELRRGEAGYWVTGGQPDD